MKNKVFLILVILLGCNPKNVDYEIATDIKVTEKYDIYYSIFEEKLKYIAIFPKCPTLKDTINILKRYECNLNPDCQVYVFRENRPSDYFGVCESIIKDEGIVICLRPIDKGAYERGILSSEIVIEINDDKYDIVYYHNYHKKAFNDSIVTDTSEIKMKHLKLSTNNFVQGAEILGELTIVNDRDSVHGQFRCIINEDRNKRDTSSIRLKEIREEEIYEFLNTVYLPNCIDTSETKKILEYTQNRIHFSEKSHIYLYLRNIEKLSDGELKFLQEQNELYQKTQLNQAFDTDWRWNSEKLSNVRVEKYNDYKKLGVNSTITHKNLYENGVVILSKPLISNDRNLMIIYEYFENNPMCSTGSIRTYVFKKVNNKWVITNLISK